jgi:molybdopterin-guanine dinucleotide biosynthesis protein A
MLGVVLAGGEGRRMGRDKAFLDAGGGPLWMRQVRVLRESGAERVVVARRRGQAPLPCSGCLFDVFAGSGPLAGLHAALSAAGGHAWVAVLAVDMPGVGPAWFARLRRFCRPGVGALARHSLSVEPLAAIYPREALGEVALRLGRRDLSVRRLALGLAAAGRMEVVTLAAAAAAAAESVNAPQA